MHLNAGTGHDITGTMQHYEQRIDTVMNELIIYQMHPEAEAGLLVRLI